MRLSRFFVDQPLALGQHDLPETQAHYIGRVLRHATGDAVQLFDGSGREYLGELVEVGKKNVRVELREQFAGQPDSPLRIHLGQGLSRGERMDWAIQKATELGVAEITPIVSERCEVRLKDERADKRLQHWRQVAISACEQCGRSSLPLIHPPLALEDWLRGRDDDLRLVLHPVAAPLASHAPPSRLAFLVGPEGGLSDAEVEQAQAAGFHSARLGPRVLRTETAPVVSVNPFQNIQVGTIGIPVPSTLCKVIGDDGQEVPLGERGELCVKGPQVMKGYWQRQEATDEILDADGWLKTGDIAIIQEDGYMRIVDRKKDMILVSGFNVYPNELEDVLATLPGVLQCAAIGIPDEKSGESIKVFVVVKPGATLTKEQVMQHMHDNLTGYKRPKAVEFRDSLPTTNVGKILRRELRDEELKKAGQK